MKRILVAAAGTGGHVLPAYRFAKHAQTRGNEIIWVGGARDIEKRYALKINAEFYSLTATGLRGKNILYALRALINLSASTIVCLYIFLRSKPDLIIVFGGYISIPVGIAAILLRKKLFTHEQNTVLGSANKVLSRFARINFLGLPLHHDSIPRAKLVGNPVGTYDQKRNSKDTGKLNIYVTGGSLGSEFINSNIPKLLCNFPEQIKIIHQSGKGYREKVQARYKNFKNVEVLEFVEDPLSVMQWSDFVISRAGALTISELIMLNKFGIIIPLPSAIDNHQLFNAEYYCNNGMGLIFQEKEDINKLKLILEDMIINLGFKKFRKIEASKYSAEHEILESILENG